MSTVDVMNDSLDHKPTLHSFISAGYVNVLESVEFCLCVCGSL